MKTRYHCISIIAAIITCVVICVAFKEKNKNAKKVTDKRPNILFVISDDQSYPYASIYGTTGLIPDKGNVEYEHKNYKQSYS